MAPHGEGEALPAARRLALPSIERLGRPLIAAIAARQLRPENHALQRRLKAAFDPNGRDCQCPVQD